MCTPKAGSPSPKILLFGVALALLLFALPAAAQDEETGREMCAACHEEIVDGFVKGRHGRLMAAAGEDVLDRSCATCHGPVEAHLEAFDAESINRRPEPSACLSCHPDAASKMARATPAHQRNGLACMDCHVSGHQGETVAEPKAEPLLAETTQKLCGDCHGDVRASFILPFAHREGSDKPFACSECHAVHGDGQKGTWAWAKNGAVCVDCHTDKAGPFIFPHAPREVDGCVTCHAPHGSPNPRQLVRHTVLNLCLECHTNVPSRSFHDFSQARFRKCQSCHRAVHGSNSDPRLFDE